jgi:hypothetical protein
VGVTGNVTVVQGTTPWNVTGNVNASVTVSNTAISSFPDAAITAFEELMMAPITPLIQSDACYGLDPDVWRQTTLNGGNITVADTGLWTMNCGTQVNSYARLFTSRYAKYQPGQGMMARFTAAFTTTSGNSRTATGVTNCVQVAGPIDREDGYAFGFSGDATNNQIGVLHRRAGKVEVRQLTITTPPGGAQTATITLNGTAYQVNLTTSTDPNYTATQIAKLLAKDPVASQYWQIDACTSVVTFTYYSSGPKNGTYSFSVTGTGTLAAGTFSQLVAGVAQVDTWTYQSAWDNQTLSINPAHLNVYAVDLRWLGAGIVRFFIEDQNTGHMTLVHTQHWTRDQTGIYPHINRPNLRISYRIGSITGVAPVQNASLSGASIMLATQGIYQQSTMSQGWYNLDSTTRAKDTAWHLLTIQNPYVRSSSLNKSQLIMQDLTVAAQGNDPSIIYIVKNARATSDLLTYSLIPGHGNPYWFAQYSISPVTTSLGSENINNVQTLGINSSAQFDLMKYYLTLAPGDTISVFIQSTNALTRTSVGLTWRVD